MLLKRVTKRGYEKTETIPHVSKAIAVPRNEILNKNTTENNKNIFDCNFHGTLPNLRYIINENWNILQTEPKLKEIFKKSP